MKISDTVRLALGNLAQAKLRTALTTMGVSIGIASLAGMVSLGVGLEDQLVGRLVQSGVFDAITVAPGTSGLGRGGFAGRGLGRGGGRGGDLAGRRGDASGTSAGTPSPDLDDAAVASIATLDHVREAYPNVRVPVEVQFGGASVVAAIAGVPLSDRNEGAFQTMAFGTFFPNDTDRTCLLSLDFTKRLTTKDPKDVVGQDLTLSYATSGTAGPLTGGIGVERADVTCRVAGIVEREGGLALGGGGLSGVMLPLRQAIAIDAVAVRSAQGIFGGPGGGNARTYTTVTVRVKGAEYTQDVEDRVKTMGFTAFSVNDALTGAKRAFIVLDIVLSLIGSIALAVSSLGIVNTMVMSILERTREIGIMKAIGGSDVDIRRIFLVEASVIGVMGGVAGVALGWLVGRIINFGANIYIQSQGGTTGNLFSLPVWLIAGAIGFSWLVSLIAGSYPAARAARLDPIQALRHD